MMTFRRTVLSFAVALALVPAAARAQGLGAASIAGVVKDASGAVLPGVTVEAASPVLIEKIRTTVTDSEGRYQLAELRPGTYSVTFTLPGFTTYKREGLQLAANFAATINADLRSENSPRPSSSRARPRSWTRAACRRPRSSARKRWLRSRPRRASAHARVCARRRVTGQRR